jgi:hypothetical protein
MNYVLCTKEEHYVDEKSTSCMHCSVIQKFKAPLGNKTSDIDLLNGLDIYDRTQNFYIFHSALKVIMESDFRIKFLAYGVNKNPDLTIEFTEEYVNYLILSLNISSFQVYDKRENWSILEKGDSVSSTYNEQILTELFVRIETSHDVVGPLCGMSCNIDLVFGKEEMKITSCSTRIS